MLLVTGLVGLAAAFVLLIEKILLLQDPSYVPSCSINPVLSCGSVMATPQAEVLGFPNPVLGVAGFAALATVGAALLAGARLRAWFWVGVQGGTTAGVLFVHWLIYQSLYVIGALCPYCMVVWIVTITAFVTTTTHLVRRDPRARTLTRYAPTLNLAWLLAIAVLIAIRFADYWASLLTG
ncbi:putative CONSERVED INTEGRAL MEMBRANE PROTEIN [Serinicoccus hydrothermalis]|uniref:Putative CONSERVED INTEGRAL MEMBRANE PROTEIN n=1 Tax=Serinicoccus hydrothermalis TaxID=1758689 RepID=A0A1B1ND26_9MICO|nr:putative CONSERVED INTEGRAL MEMBRANE PROTEIN [Serinicoccus hydrothermalis]